MEEVKEHIELIEKLVKANPKFSGNEDLLEDFCSETYQKSYLILQSTTDLISLQGYMKKVVSSAIMDVLKNSGRLSIKTSSNNVKLVEKPEAKTIIKEEVQDNSDFGLEQNNEETSGNIEIKDETEATNIDVFDEEIVDEQEKTVDIEVNTKQETNIETEIPEDKTFWEEDPPYTLQGPYEYNKAPILAQDLLYVADPRENIEEQVIGKDIIENIINLVKEIDKEQPQEMFFVLFKERYYLRKKQREIAKDIGISQAEVSKRLVQLSRLIKEKLY